MPERGVVYVAFGEAARREAGMAVKALRHLHPDLPVVAIGEPVEGACPLPMKCGDLTSMQASRWAKVCLYDQSPFQHTLYMDADTLVRQPVTVGFDILADGWDVALAASDHQGGDVFWHVGEEEREMTLLRLAHVPVQLQAGVMWFAKNGRTKALFRTWKREWLRWADQDQAALLRALERSPAKVWILGRPWNGGGIVAHRFGRARKG